MALTSQLLQAQYLLLSAAQRPETAAVAAQKWADVYSSYGALGMAGGTFPLLAPGPGASAMASGLTAAFLMPVGIPSVVAAALGAMVTAYWTSATFATAPGPGIAAPPPGVSALISGATALLSNKNNSADSFASQMATLLDTCTRTVLVTVPAPTPYTLPVA